MFTGIVEGTGTVVERTETDDGLRLRIDADGLAIPEPGASVSVSGCCLTVEARDDGAFETFLAEETRAVTYLGDLAVGDAVNLERAMPADGRFDGHLVQGHVDGTTTLAAVREAGEDWRYTFELPDDARYVVPKGSVALDGISLTVAAVDADGEGVDGPADADGGTFDVAIIPETRRRTTFSAIEPGDPVHIEYDVVAKYVESMRSGERA